ncbi:MAG: glycosyl hydrolase family 98 [Bacteroidaceae bacterium]|nr:glycosyl hydrolase family 98 [Bacteroidaceae bacterium]
MLKRIILSFVMALAAIAPLMAQQRRPVDNKHPMWLVHVDVWNYADPQKIINLIPEDIRPFVVMNLSLSCSYNKEQGIYERPNSAIRTYKSWASVCQQNGMWFTCQPASGGHTHIKDNDLETFEYFFTHYPNFLGWNYAEQFWGFDEAGDPSSSSQATRLALFAKLVPMHHKYGGFLTISFCGSQWSHLLNPVGMMKRNAELLQACKDYPEAILWLYKYTHPVCFYNNESVCFGPFVSGLAKNYGVRYDNCGWNDALNSVLGDNHGKKYPIAAGIGTVMEQTCVNGGAVWDGPELIWTEDFQGLSNTTSSAGYQQRRWGTFPGFDNAWIDMFRRIIDGTLYIPSRKEVVDKTKIIIINNVTSGNDEDKYGSWGDLYDNLYKVSDPFNRGNGQLQNNLSYMKSSGRYGAIPITPVVWGDDAKAIPLQVKKSTRTSTWSSLSKKKADFDKYYPEVSKGTLYVNRYHNQLITYNPYSYLSKNTRRAKADIPLLYNTCESLHLDYYELSSGAVREYADHIDFYLNNYRTDTTAVRADTIRISGVASEPETTFKVLGKTSISPKPQGTVAKNYDAEAKTFTVTVKHMGPCQLTINCQGEGTDRLTDYLSSEALTDLPKQPEPYFGPITIEAEDMDYKSIANHVTFYMAGFSHVRNHSGNGFVVMGTNTSGSLQHTLKNVPEEGEYYISVRYTNSASKTGTLALKANTAAAQNVEIKKTGTNEWLRTGATFKLKKGTNTFTITNNKGINLTIDQITYRPVEFEEEKFDVGLHQAEHGVVTANKTAACEGEEVKLEAIPDDGYRLSGWHVIHGNINIQADGTFIMPDEFVTIEPIFEDVNVIYQINIAAAGNGNLPEGWRVTQENGEKRDYPGSYGSGSRIMVGFSGYQGAALYWREGSCEYGRLSKYPLNLAPGHYKLTYAMAAWKGTPYYRAEVLDPAGQVIATGDDSSTTPRILASPNADGNTSAKVSTARLRTLSFEAAQQGKYVIRFSNYTDGSGFQEFLLLDCKLSHDPEADGIFEMAADPATTPAQQGIYNLMGIKTGTSQRGVNIVRTADGRTIKILK